MAKTNLPPNLIKEISKHLRPLNSAKYLVELGLAGSVKSLANQRFTGEGPDFIKLSGTGIRYPKDSVLSWLDDHSVFVRS